MESGVRASAVVTEGLGRESAPRLSVLRAWCLPSAETCRGVMGAAAASSLREPKLTPSAKRTPDEWALRSDGGTSTTDGAIEDA
jgi:hypothetical protein